MISESCTTQRVVKVGTLGEASMMTSSNTVTVSAAAVVYHKQVIVSDAVANYEMQEAEQTSLLSFPENNAGISTQTLIETRCENKQNDDLHPAISSGDIGRVVKLKSERNLTDNEKYVLLKKLFIPAASYKFPCHSINGQKRSFQHSCLSRYNGLVYSESQDGGYCKFCVMFGKCECSVNEFGVLVVRPFT